MATTYMSPNSPSDALIQLLAPDGYYEYFGITKPTNMTSVANTNADSGVADDLNGSGGDNNNNNNNSSPTTSAAPISTIDDDLVKKTYRKLSLKHHPDRASGDVETFRRLKRAQTVLLNPNLRKEYDILGIDLDDEEDDDDLDENNEDSKDKTENAEGERPSTSQKIIHEIASTALTSVLQLGVRTVMTGLVSVILVRFRWLLYPTLLFLAYILYQTIQRMLSSGATSYMDSASPLLISLGLLIMHTGRSSSGGWTFQFWIGESLVIGIFSYNSFFPQMQQTPLINGGLLIFAVVAALWFRGSVWNYATVVGFEAFAAIFVTMAFPVFEMLLETILNEKLRKVGDKIRVHHRLLEEFYRKKNKN